MLAQNFLVTVYQYLSIFLAWLPGPFSVMLYTALGICVIIAIIKIFAFILDCIPFW